MSNYIYGNKLASILRRYRRMPAPFRSLLSAWLTEDHVINGNATKESFVPAA